MLPIKKDFSHPAKGRKKYAVPP